jgi:hypothetical protein
MRHLGCSAFRFPRCGRGAKNGIRNLRPVHPTRIVPLGAVSDDKLYLCAMLPLERVPLVWHTFHLKNLYMAFSYNDNYRKMSFILEWRYHYPQSRLVSGFCF